MTGDQIIIIIIAFISSYITSYFLRGYLRERQIIRVFLQHKIVREEMAIKMSELPFPETNHKPIRLLPFVYLFQKKILKVTKDNRVYFNKRNYRRKLIQDASVLLACYLVFVGVILLTLYL